MIKQWIILSVVFFVVLFISACTKIGGEDTIPEDVTKDQQPRTGQQSGPVNVNCIITPETVREVCAIDSSIGMRSAREDIARASNKRCWIMHKAPDTSNAVRLNTESNTLLGYDADRLSDLGKYDTFDAYKKVKTKIVNIEINNREIPGLGDRAFITFNPTYNQILGQEEYNRSEDTFELSLYAIKDDIVFQLDISNKGRLVKGPIGDTEVVGIAELCSPDEAVELMRRMIGSMVVS